MFFNVVKFQCGHVRIGEHIGLSPLTKKKLSLRTAPYPVIYYFATIQHPMMVLVF